MSNRNLRVMNRGILDGLVVGQGMMRRYQGDKRQARMDGLSLDDRTRRHEREDFSLEEAQKTATDRDLARDRLGTTQDREDIIWGQGQEAYREGEEEEAMGEIATFLDGYQREQDPKRRDAMLAQGLERVNTDPTMMRVLGVGGDSERFVTGLLRNDGGGQGPGGWTFNVANGKINGAGGSYVTGPYTDNGGDPNGNVMVMTDDMVNKYAGLKAKEQNWTFGADGTKIMDRNTGNLRETGYVKPEGDGSKNGISASVRKDLAIRAAKEVDQRMFVQIQDYLPPGLKDDWSWAYDDKGQINFSRVQANLKKATAEDPEIGLEMDKLIIDWQRSNVQAFDAVWNGDTSNPYSGAAQGMVPGRNRRIVATEDGRVPAPGGMVENPNPAPVEAAPAQVEVPVVEKAVEPGQGKGLKGSQASIAKPGKKLDSKNEGHRRAGRRAIEQALDELGTKDKQDPRVKKLAAEILNKQGYQT